MGDVKKLKGLVAELQEFWDGIVGQVDDRLLKIAAAVDALNESA